MEETSNNTILKTKNYENFKYIEGNRNIDKKHVRDLKLSIEKNNLLNIKPIFIDNENFIIDGQHRLEAARELEIDIYYQIINSINHKEIVTLNQNNKNWKINDFLIFHAIRNKNNNYIKIIQILEKNNWNLKEFFIYTSYNIRKKDFRNQFEEGSFVFLYSEEILDDKQNKWLTFKNFCTDKGIEHLDSIDSLCFKESFLFFHSCKIIKIDQFWEKLRGNINLFHRCGNKDEYIDMFLRIYNFSMSYKIEKGMLI